MAQVGEKLYDPVRGQSLIFRRTAEETNGELVEVEAVYRAGSEVPPEHVHPEQEEFFEVLGGSIDTCVGGQKRRYEVGESFRVPAGVVHQMWNGGSEEARLVWQVRPALRTELFFEIWWGLAQEGKTNKAGLPNLLQLAVILRQYRRELRLVKPPLVVQNSVFAILAVMGRVCGYSAVRVKARRES